MEDFLKRRRFLRKRVNNFKTKIENGDELSKGMFEIMEEQLQELWSDIRNCTDDIMTTCESDDEEEHGGVFDAMNDEFNSVKYLLKTILTSFEGRKNEDGVTTTRGRNQANDAVKLPKLELPSFGGSYLEWTAFADLFRASVHNQNLSGAQKLQYLKGALRGEALQLVQSYSISDANYLEAWEVLQRRYQNNRELVRTQIAKFLNQPYLKEKNAAGLRLLVDTSSSCIRALKTMGYENAIDEENYWISFILMDRLDPETRELWESKLGRNTMPKWSELIDFLDERVSILSSAIKDVKAKVIKPFDKKIVSAHQTTTVVSCPICGESHFTYQCKKFIDMNVNDKTKIVKEKHLCFNCLKTGHDASKCTWGGSCRKCKQKHSTMLHTDPAPTAVDSVSAHTATVSKRALMSTAQVCIQDSEGSLQRLRALLDPGADVSFLSEDALQMLGLKKIRTDVTISGVGGTSTGESKYFVEFKLNSMLDKEFEMNVHAYILPKITSLLPKNKVLMSEYVHLQNVTLADPTFFNPGTIDVLLGADVCFHIFRDGRITGKDGHPVGLFTVWGYVVGGQCPSQAVPQRISVHHVNCDVTSSISRFWEIEEIPKRRILTEEERKCEQHFATTHTRSQDGRYVIRLPFKENVPQLGISVNAAERRLKSMERRLVSNPELKQQYVKFMREYIDLGHMELIPEDEISKPADQVYYLPHHEIIKAESTTTKLRVVFDASAVTSNKISLNDRLITGPKLQDDLFDLLIRFRLFRVAMKADIAKMFRQIWVNAEDCDYQRILWRESPDHPIRHYRLLTVTYGTSVAPYLAKRCLQQLAEDEAEVFPNGSYIAKTDMYMDDLMSSQPEEQNAMLIQQQLIELMKKGGFDLRKWTSNCSAILEAVPENMRETALPLQIDETDSVKTLGLCYHPLTDQFKFNVNVPKSREALTKRGISSDIGKVFDPIGWLAPVTIMAKILFQSLWKAQLDWDDEVDADIADKWHRYTEALPEIANVRIPRCLLPCGKTKYHLYGFSDASEVAYGAVIYIQSVKNGEPQILAAKTKVAPTRQISLPRLELCAALLLSRLVDAVLYALPHKPEDIVVWTDSMIVLHWLKSSPNRWKTFVANRVSEIQDVLPSRCWHHVPGQDNPADCISRGILASELKDHPLWWHGPSWLKEFPSQFEEQSICIDADDHIEEKVEITILHTKAELTDFSLLYQFSSLSKILRVTARILRFGSKKRREVKKLRGPLLVSELRDALNIWIKLVQSVEFPIEIHCLNSGKSIDRSSKILCLNPFLDEGSVLRVGGRLKNADIPTNHKHPILLPKKHRLVDLIIVHEHIVGLHAGAQLLLAQLHQKYWILGARDLVRKQIHNCVTCCRHRAEIATQMMADLPAARINPCRAFLKTGVDYAGPLSLRVIKGKGHKFYKGYIAIFICFVTRAIHIELVTDLSSGSFIKALRRFCGRRGKPSDLYSDNGRTFVGAQKQLRFTASKEYNEEVGRFLAEQEISFHWNPPAAPHFGGLWEAGIKSLKFHLKRVLGMDILNYEEMSTLLIQIEACLNSRPLSPMSTDPTDFLPLTPGHFLIGDALTAPADPTYLDESDSYQNKWKKVQKMYHNFWKRWSSEYLTRLQQRPKWLLPKRNIQVDDLVLVKDSRLPPLKWKLGRVTQLHSGDDQLVRVVSLLTSEGVVKRPIVKICLLPIN